MSKSTPLPQPDAPSHVLVVDDDARLRTLLRDYLSSQGFFVTTAEHAADAREMFARFQFDAAILDVMMPGEDGISLGADLRTRTDMPILFLTARGDAVDRIAGLRAGADDYLPKPFEPEELVLRLQAILRRGMGVAQPVQSECQLGPYRWSPELGELHGANGGVKLSDMENRLLRALAARPGAPHSREELAERMGITTASRSIDVMVVRLRRKLGDDPQMPRILQTLRGQGYVSHYMSPFRARRYLPRTLFARSLLIVITPVIVLQILMAYSFLNQDWQEMTNKLSYSVAREIAFVIEMQNDHPDADPNKILQLASDTMGLRFEYVPGKKMSAIEENRQDMLSRMIGSAVKHRLSYPARIERGAGDETFEIEVITPRGLLRVTVPEKRVFTITTFQFIFWFTAAGAVMLLISILFLRGQVRPIRRLAEAAEAFGNGVDRPFKLEGAREVRRAGTAFLLMRERIKRQIAQRTEMLAGVSHDLRTPLTRMKLQLAMVKDAGAAELKSDVAEMEAMIEAYLMFARGEGEESAVPVQMDEFLAQLLRDSARVGEASIRLGAVPMKLTVRPQAMRRAFSNLVQNALGYGTQCDVTMIENEDRAMVLIDDNGPGIPAAAREDVFRPFFRLEQSRNRASGGIGLGLAIARDIIRAHGGEITLEDSPLGGLRARVELPR